MWQDLDYSKKATSAGNCVHKANCPLSHTNKKQSNQARQSFNTGVAGVEAGEDTSVVVMREPQRNLTNHHN